MRDGHSYLWFQTIIYVCEIMKNNGFKDIDPSKLSIKDPEINKHDRMKLFGRKLLFYMGITARNIYEEETVSYNGKRYRVDLVGYPGKYHAEHPKLAIAIECGDNKAEKIEALRNSFSFVLILPYQEFDFIEQPEIKLIQKLTQDLEQQTISNNHYLRRLQSTEGKFQEIDKLLNEKLEKTVQEFASKISKDFEGRIKRINDTLSDYELELEGLKEFKTFCENFGKKYR